MLGRTPPSIQVVRPLRGGAITHFASASHLIGHLLQCVSASRLFRIAPVVFASVPEDATPVERRAIHQSLRSAGAKQVRLVRKPIAAAIGAAVDIWRPTASLVVDIGGGTCEISLLSLGDLVGSHTLRIGGDAMDHEVASYIRRALGVLVGEQTAESVKLAASQRIDGHIPRSITVKGRHAGTGLPQAVTVAGQAVIDAASSVLDPIASAIFDVIYDAPPDIMGDVLENGIILTGGAARLDGLADALAARMGFAVRIADQPDEAVVRGLVTIMSNRAAYRHVFAQAD